MNFSDSSPAEYGAIPPSRRRRRLDAAGMVLALLAALAVLLPGRVEEDLGAGTDAQARMAMIPQVDAGIAAEHPPPPQPASGRPGPPAPVAAPAPAAAPPAAPAPAPAARSVAELCRDALAASAKLGLPLPAGVEYRCPSTQYAHQGAACWDWGPCRGGGFIAINMELLADESPEYLRYVVAHEVCHIRDFRTRGYSSEPSAHACAEAHGA